MFRRFLATVAVSVSVVVTTAAPAAAAEPLLPDLGMARLADLAVTTTSDGRRLLRFSATIVNTGRGPFELTAGRPDTAAAFTGAQRITATDGSTALTAVPASFVFAGDGHTHWHVRDLQRYQLERLDNGVKVGTSAKGGFCFFDTTAYRLSLVGAPQSPRYRSAGCGGQSATSLEMGLSVGWGDRYGWTLPDQYIEITGLANGKYRLRATADALGLFTEADRTDNDTWVDVSISSRRGTTSVKVLGYGPAA